ncbi:MAG: LysE family transporter [Pseudomonadota bacterium]
MLDYIPNPLVIPIGLAIGFLVAAPIGPVNILCIQRALERGFLGGVAAGSGAVLGDGIIALSASLGISAISGAIETYKGTIQIVGGVALVAFGLNLWFQPPQIIASVKTTRNLPARAYLLDISNTFFLTLMNPGAVLSLFAIFGGIGTFVELSGYVDALLLVAAIVAGNLAWWVFLSFLTGYFSQHFKGKSLSMVNKISSLLLIAFGGVLLGEIIAVRMDMLDSVFFA